MIYWKSLLIYLFSLLFSMGGCAPSYQPDEVNTIIQHTKNHFISDSRVDRFEVKAEIQSDSLVLTGETTVQEAKSALFDSLSSRDITYTDHIRMLPSADLKDQTFALVNNSVANIRSEPGHAAQLATQALLGMPLRVLERHHGWYLIRTPDDYISWVNGSNIKRMNQSQYNDWKEAAKVIYTTTYGFSYQKPSRSAGHVTDLVAGNILKLQGNESGYYQVTYPDGRTAYVAQDEAKPFDQWNKDLQVTKTSLVKEAKTMMGVPYLWGGTSTKGVDCSGFTKTIYFMNGRILPRDASQQVYAGKRVDKNKHWENLEVGDLLFFGHPATDSTARRVVHVGMWIGNNEFIHSSGYVHISSMDSTADNFDPYNLGRYLEARRYLSNWKGNIMQTADMYNWGHKRKDREVIN